MDTTSRYSFIACPACGKTFKFWDDFKNTSTGKVMKCPKCQCMFAFQVVEENEEILERPYTADVNDTEASSKFIEEMNSRLKVSEKSASRSAKSDSSSEENVIDILQVSPPRERKARPNE